VEGETLDAATELTSKLVFAREGEQWEATSKQDGSLVVAVDCTQDEATQSSGMCRELMNAIQQLRKTAELDLSDVVEAFFEESGSLVEAAVGRNVAVFEAKLRGSVPLPRRFAPKWSVELKSAEAEIGGSNVRVCICRPALAARDDLPQSTLNVLSTLQPNMFSNGQDYNFEMNGVKSSIKEGTDFWITSRAKLQATKALEWA